MFLGLFTIAVVLLGSTDSTRKDANQETQTDVNTGYYEYIKDIKTWLKLHVIPVTWHQAQLKCQIEGGVVTTPTTTALTTAMKEMLYKHNLAEKSVFTGLHSPFLKGEFTSVDGATLKNVALKWAIHEPNNVDNKEDCVVMSGAGLLADVDCNIVHPFFCNIENSGMCNARNKDYIMDPRTGSCYKVHQERRGWVGAALTCSMEHGHLAIINSEKESKVLADLLVDYPKYENFIHTGFWDEFHNNTWKTILGEEINNGSWYKNVTTEYYKKYDGYRRKYCGAINRQGLLTSVNCTDQLMFICEIDS